MSTASWLRKVLGPIQPMADRDVLQGFDSDSFLHIDSNEAEHFNFVGDFGLEGEPLITTFVLRHPNVLTFCCWTVKETESFPKLLKYFGTALGTKARSGN